MKRQALIALLLLLAFALFGGWYFISPLSAMNGLREAAQSGSEEALEGSVDFPVLRENLKSELRERMESELASAAGSDLGGLGASLGMAMIDPVVDGLVTPEAIATIVRQGRVLPQEREGAPADEGEGKPQWELERGFSSFTARSATGGTALVFERRGLGWKLVGIELPES